MGCRCGHGIAPNIDLPGETGSAKRIPRGRALIRVPGVMPGPF
ncbi:porin protein [Ralstonia solanacearum IPO1609]|uniref:Porin protein n=1 Tax=Ralstonia solanacearum IPO1609 TaxID=564066 RepID=A0A7U7JDR8_RALSL|nr:porin protein [Ralstonia solanacearum IPO1609]